MVDSTQQLVRKPPMASVLMLLLLSDAPRYNSGSKAANRDEVARSVAEQGAGNGAGDDEERLLFEAVVGAVLRLQGVVHGVEAGQI